MTESEDLKASAERMRQKEKVAEMEKYIDILIARVETTLKRDRDAIILYTIIWACWVLSSILVPAFSTLFETFFICGLIYSGVRTAQRARAFGEFRGCIKTLEILGMIPPISPKGDTENKKQVWSEGADIVKGWFTKKKKMQDKVLVPA